MADRPKVFLHIGYGKVASSTIQRFLHRNADEIRRQGFLISNVNLEFPLAGPVEGYPVRILKDWMGNPEDRAERLSKTLGKAIESREEKGLRGIIVSSEFLSTPAAASWFGEIATDFDFEVVFYLRRQDQWMESAWKQWGMKQGASLAEFVGHSLKTGNPHYLRTALAWRETAGALTVTPIEAVNDIQSHFSDWCGLDFTKLQSVEPDNRTYDWALLDLMSRSPFLFSDRDDNLLFRFLDESLPEGTPRNGHGLLSADLAWRILDSFADENRQIRREFFPNLPECDWDHPYIDEEKMGRETEFGSIDSVFRNLGFQLMISRHIHQSLQARDPELELASLADRAGCIEEKLKRRFDRLRSEIKRERARREDLETRLKRLESRSLGKRIARFFRGFRETNRKDG